MLEARREFRQSDVAIVGGGPAGSVAAALLASRGLDAVLFDRDRFPRDKLCGEFLSGEAIVRIDEIGALGMLLALEPPRIGRLRLTAPRAPTLELELPVEAFGVSRVALDAILLDAARARGARVVERAMVREIDASRCDGEEIATLEIERRDQRPPLIAHHVARAGILACGRSSSLLRARARVARADRERRLRGRFAGFKRHHRLRATSDGPSSCPSIGGCVELHVFEGGYCGVAPIEGGRVNVCLLASEAWIRARRVSAWEDVARAASESSEALARRLETLEPLDTPTLATAGIDFEDRERALGAWIRAGDAAGMVAPFSGCGQAMAIESGALAAEIIARALESPERGQLRLSEMWDRAWSREFHRGHRVARLVQSALTRPALARVGLAAATRFPRIAEVIARATRARPVR